MDKCGIRRIIRNTVIRRLINAKGLYYVPAAVSNRHIHLSEADIERLFGRGYKFTGEWELSQPGQYSCAEKVSLSGSKGTIHNVRVLGPARQETQVEISLTDSYTLGVKAPVRMSGELDGTPGIRVSGPRGCIDLERGLIIAARHLHMSEKEASCFGLKNGDVVSVSKAGDRPVTFGNVMVRTGDGHSLELHIDTDEANAAGISNGQLLLLEREAKK